MSESMTNEEVKVKQGGAELAPERDQAERFLALLDPGATKFTFQTFDDVAKRKSPRLAQILHGSLDELWDRLVGLNIRRAGIFVTVNETDGKGRKVENITRVRAIHQDDDAGHGWTVPGIEPSIDVETSTGKAQRYITVDGLSFEDHAAAMEVMSADHGNDKGAKDVARVLRVPGFAHQKDASNPHLVRIIGGDGRRYTSEQIRAALPARVREKKPASVPLVRMNLLDAETIAKVKSASAFLHEKTDGAYFRDYDTWLAFLMALHHESGGSEIGYQLGSELAQQYCPEKFDRAGQWRTWNSLHYDRENPLTLGTFFHDAREHGWQTAEEAQQAKIDAEVARLAKLSRGLYDQAREEAAKTLGLRAKTLDTLVAEQRAELEAKEKGSGLLFAEDDPWEQPVDGGELLAALVATIKRYVVLADEAAVAVASWIMFAHAHDAALISPILAILSPEKQCGKTTLVTSIQELVPKGFSASGATEAVIFRLVDKFAPTLLLDEGDRWINDDNGGLVAALNCGHNRRGAVYSRCVGDDHDIKPFKVWAPKVIAGIDNGKLPDTLRDRSIVISLRRRLDSEQVEKLRLTKVEHLIELRRKAARWASDHLEAIRQRDPLELPGLGGRAADNWHTIFAIADEVGGEWVDRIRSAALSLSGVADEALDSTRFACSRTFGACSMRSRPSYRSRRRSAAAQVHSSDGHWVHSAGRTAQPAP